MNPDDEDDVLPLDTRPTKRQRRNNLNSRFERMLQRVDSSVASTTKVSAKRSRIASAGSSSSLGYDMPKTPIDIYHSAVEGEGSVGDGFAVIKLATSPRCRKSGSPTLPSDDEASFEMDGKQHPQVCRFPWSHGTIARDDVAISDVTRKSFCGSFLYR